MCSSCSNITTMECKIITAVFTRTMLSPSFCLFLCRAVKDFDFISILIWWCISLPCVALMMDFYPKSFCSLFYWNKCVLCLNCYWKMANITIDYLMKLLLRNNSYVKKYSYKKYGKRKQKRSDVIKYTRRHKRIPFLSKEWKAPI